MDKEMLRSLTQIDYSKAEYECFRLLRGEKDSIKTNDVVALASMAYATRKNDFSDRDDLLAFLDGSIEDYTAHAFLFNFVQEHWDKILKLSETNGKELLSVALFSAKAASFSGETCTPESINLLALKLLDVQEGETVTDLCSGSGSFLIDTYIRTNAASLLGIDISTEAVTLARIRSWLLGDILDIQQGNVLNMLNSKLQADKVFSNFPFRSRVEEVHNPNAVYQEFLDKTSLTDRADWGFLLAALANQKKGGRTVVVTTIGMLFRVLGKATNIREVFVNSGKLEAVITLPAGLFSYTAIPCALLVFSQDNKAVRLIDASHLGEKKGRQIELTEDDMQKILTGMQHDSENSCSVTPEQLKSNAYNLQPDLYLHAVSVENGMPLKKLSISINRGANIPSRELNDASSDVPTMNRYLMLKDIDKGRVSENMMYLADIDAKYHKNLVQSGDLLVSRNAPFKLAVMPDIGGQKVLVNGNLYFIHLDADKVHPIYVMLYLMSAQGMRQLNMMANGVAISSISAKGLEDIEIPMIPMSEQMKIVEKYQSLLLELEAAEKQIQTVHERMASLMGGEA